MSGETGDRNYTDGQFFDFLKRLMDKGYTDPQGNPGLRSDQLVRPRKISVVKSNGARWTRIYINRAVYLFSSDGRRVDYVSGEHPGDVSAATPSPWNSSVTGVCKLFAPGEWHVKTPLLAGDVEGDPMAFMETDAAAGVGMDVSASEIAGQIAVGELINVYKIGGTIQTGLDLMSLYVKRTQQTPPAAFNVTTGTGSTVALAARAGRRSLYAVVMNMAGGCTKVTTSFLTGVVSLKGYQFNGNDAFKSWDALSGISEDAVYAITDAGTADIYFVEMT
jgi:hypothetical protein